MNIDIFEIIQLAVVLLISIWMHEYAHALVSYKLGDPTPHIQWRVTPNPFKHLDPVGFLMIFLIHFGRWKPVQINPSYYKKPLQWELMVALAWPATNIALSIIGIFVLLVYGRFAWLGLAEVLLNQTDFVLSFWKLFSFLNIALAVFNLLPIPPLDGFTLVKVISPKAAAFVQQYQKYVMIFFLVLIFWPGREIIGNVIRNTTSVIFDLIFSFFSFVIY